MSKEPEAHRPPNSGGEAILPRKMKFSILADTDSTHIVDGEYITINLAYFAMPDRDPRNVIPFLRGNFREFFVDQDTNEFHTSFQPLVDSFNALCNESRLPRSMTISRLHAAIMNLYAGLSVLKQSIYMHHHDSILKDLPPHSLFVRFGNVELRCLDNYLFRRAELQNEVKTIFSESRSSDYMIAPRMPGSWITADDINCNVRNLCTNAGFYARDPDSAWNALASWAEAYMAGLVDGSLIRYLNAAPHFFAVQLYLREHFGKKVSYTQFPENLAAYDLFDGKQVLIVSPLAHLIEHQFKSGRLWRLYKDKSVPRFGIRALPAYISTWPNSPHSDFQETFDVLCSSIDAAIASETPDLFTASCGMYGIPLCHYVWKRYGISSLYVGNVLHAFFGIRQKSTEQFLASIRNEEEWIDSDLNKYPGVNLIDGGRYI